MAAGNIVGGSLAAARLRADTWQSVFTHDMRRYSRALYRFMGNLTTLIVGPSGTGKELVARAIHFDGARRERAFVEVNCASLPSQLVEAELFGHERGPFTDAKGRKLGLVEAANGNGSAAAGAGGFPPALPAEGIRLEDVERDLVVQALEREAWNVTRAARLLGLSRDTLRYRIEKYRLKEQA